MRPRTGKYIKCKTCENLRWRFKSEIKKGKKNFCSMECYRIDGRTLPIKELNMVLNKIYKKVIHRIDVKETLKEYENSI